MIEIKNLSKRFAREAGEFAALSDIDVTFPDTGMYGIVGQSGAGKTTLLNIIGTIDSPTSGEVLIDGKRVDYSKRKNKRRILKEQISFIFQEYNLVNNLSVVDNVLLGGCGKAEARELLERVGLSDKVKSDVRFLSGGEKQRVAIARGLARGSKILLIDEPSSSLDEQNEDNIYQILRELARDHLVIVVSHNEDLVAASCDGIVRLASGRLVENTITKASSKNACKAASKRSGLRLAHYFKYFFNFNRRRRLGSLLFMAITFLFFTFAIVGISFEDRSARIKEEALANCPDSYIKLSLYGKRSGMRFYEVLKEDSSAAPALTVTVDLGLERPSEALIIDEEMCEEEKFNYFGKEYQLEKDSVIISDYLFAQTDTTEGLKVKYARSHDFFRLNDPDWVRHPISSQRIETDIPSDPANLTDSQWLDLTRIIIPSSLYSSDLADSTLSLKGTYISGFSQDPTDQFFEFQKVAQCQYQVVEGTAEITGNLTSSGALDPNYVLAEDEILISRSYARLLKDFSFESGEPVTMASINHVSPVTNLKIVGLVNAGSELTAVVSDQLMCGFTEKSLGALVDSLALERGNPVLSELARLSIYSFNNYALIPVFAFAESLANISIIFNFVGLFFGILGMIFIVLVFVHDLAGRSHEIAIFKSLGIGSLPIDLLYFFNTVVLLLLSFSLSALAGWGVLSATNSYIRGTDSRMAIVSQYVQLNVLAVGLLAALHLLALIISLIISHLRVRKTALADNLRAEEF